MSDLWTRIVVVGLLVLIVGVPFVLQPEDEAAARTESARSGGGRLVIITPHNEQIRYEMERGFNAWRAAEGKPPVEFDWRSSGGTSDLRNQVLHELQKAARLGREDDGLGYDLFFGGGDYEHGKLAKGVTITRDGQTLSIPATVPIDLPESLLEEVYPEPTIGGEPLYHRERRWVGVVLASFGIVYNRDVLDMLGLPEPMTWADLQDPRYVGWVALADPGHSGSIATTYNAIVRRAGWTEGWAMLRRIFANARYFTASAAKVPVDVSSGEAAAGMCIDFYGRFQAGAVGGDRVGYVDPAMMTAINADPISIVRGAPSPELAREFVLWLLTRPSQRLWQRRLGMEDGPRRYELRRMPIRRDLYNADEQRAWVDRIDPFALAAPYPKAMPNYFSAIEPLSHAMAIDVHDELVRAWRTIQRLEGPAKAEALALFDAMPSELALQWPSEAIEAQWRAILDDPQHPDHAAAAQALAEHAGRIAEFWSKPDVKLAKRLEWSAFFRGNYERIIAMGR